MSTNYAMFTPEADLAIGTAVREYQQTLIDAGKSLRLWFEEIRLDHPEIGDTAVREIIYADLRGVTQRFYETEFDFYDGVVKGLQ